MNIQYVSVISGGYTVFPLAGAAVKPERGSVVLWWNMDQGCTSVTTH